MVVLEFVRGSQEGTKVELDKARITMGRDPESDIVLTDQRASWLHCVIEWTEQGYILIDQGSSNGTYLGDDLRPVTVPERLTYGESIWFGDTELVFRTNLEVQGHSIASTGNEPPKGSTMAIDARAALAMMEQVHQLKAMKQRKRRPVQGRRLNSNPAEVWEGVTTESVVIDDVLTEEDVETFPDSFRLRARLVFLAGPHEGREIYLGSDATTFGRDDDNVCKLADDGCSRHHAEVVRDEKGIYYLRDLGSRNGTAINGKDIRDKTALQHRCLITFGQSVVEFHSQNIDTAKENPLATVSMSLPLYAFQGKVLTQYELSLGLDPTSDLFLDDRSVDRHHATIQWRGDHFQLRDSSNRGTKVNDKRIIQHDLEDGDRIQIGVFTLTMSIEGIRANIEIEKIAFKDARESFVAAAPERSAYKTMFRIDVPAVLKERTPVASNQEEKLSEGITLTHARKKLTWVAPMETHGSFRLPLMLFGGMMTVVLLVLLFIVTGGKDFMNEPLTEVHNSKAFAAVAAAKDINANCLACHTVFNGVSEDSCSNCHGEVKHRARHIKPKGSIKGIKAFETGCNNCHTEHKTKEELITSARNSCTNKDCHGTDPHKSVVTAAPDGLEKAQEKAFDVSPKNIPLTKLHKAHSNIQRRCIGCHSDEDGSGPINPRTACFRCHDSTKAKGYKSGNECFECHDVEHKGSEDIAPLANIDQDTIEAATAPFDSPIPPIAKGFLLAIIIFIPLGFILGSHSVYRNFIARRNAEKDFIPPANPDNYYVLIDPETCVAISACAYACPYNVIDLEGSPKQAVAKRIGACHGCRACEKVCTPNAIIVVKQGEGLPSKDFPDLDPYYQVPEVPGLFLIGQVTEFKGLMKNASNMAVRVLKYVTETDEGGRIKAGSASASGIDFEVFIAGAGPGGVSAAVTASQMGLAYKICEKSAGVANTHRNMPKGKQLQPNPPLLGGIGPAVPAKYDTPERPKEKVIEDFEHVLRQNGVEVSFKEEVKSITQEGAGFKITTTTGEFTALKVIIAIGNNGNPRKPNCPGEDLEKVNYRLADPDEYNGKKIVVLGGGNSAVEAAFALADANGGSNEVTLSYRKGMEKMRISGMNKEKLKEYSDAGKLNLMLPTSPKEIKESTIILTDGGTKEDVEMPNDVTFVFFGSLAPRKWLEKIGVKYASKPANWNPGPTDDLSFLDA